MNELIAMIKSGKAKSFAHTVCGEDYRHHMTCHVGEAMLTACGSDLDATATELLAALEKHEKTTQKEAVRRTEAEQRVLAFTSRRGAEVRFDAELICMESDPPQDSADATLDIGDKQFKRTFNHWNKAAMRALLIQDAVRWIEQFEAVPCTHE